jgi:amino acid permease
MTTIVSHTVYDWFLSGLTGLVAAYWIGIDSYRLRKALRMAPRDAAVRDRIFGSSLGIVVGIVGVAGVVMHHVK